MIKKIIVVMIVCIIIDDIEVFFIVNKLRIKNVVINIKENLIVCIISVLFIWVFFYYLKKVYYI